MVRPHGCDWASLRPEWESANGYLRNSVDELGRRAWGAQCKESVSTSWRYKSAGSQRRSASSRSLALCPSSLLASPEELHHLAVRLVGGKRGGECIDARAHRSAQRQVLPGADQFLL